MNYNTVSTAYQENISQIHAYEAIDGNSESSTYYENVGNILNFEGWR